MIAKPANVVLTAHMAHWVDDGPTRVAWILGCLGRHNTGDWGALDADDTAANHHALSRCDGRLLSCYPIPTELTDPTIDDGAIWIVTDDLADPDAPTTILWPSEH